MKTAPALALLLTVGCHQITPTPAPPAPACGAGDVPPSLSCPVDWTSSEELVCTGDEVPKGCMKLGDLGAGVVVACCCENWGDDLTAYDCGVVA